MSIWYLLTLLQVVLSRGATQAIDVASGETLTEIWIRAARYDDLETIEALIRDDALDLDTSYSSDSEENALVVSSAAGHESIVRALIEAGVDTDHRSSPKKSTALMRAARQGHAQVCRLLIEDGGADALLTNRVGVTALHLVAMREHLADKGIIELIVEEEPAACFAKDLKKRTPLDLAEEKENYAGAEILRRVCASPAN